jgi:hypothetical protein
MRNSTGETKKSTGFSGEGLGVESHFGLTQQLRLSLTRHRGYKVLPE